MHKDLSVVVEVGAVLGDLQEEVVQILRGQTSNSLVFHLLVNVLDGLIDHFLVQVTVVLGVLLLEHDDEAS